MRHRSVESEMLAVVDGHATGGVDEGKTSASSDCSIRFRGEQGVQRVRTEDAPALDGVRCIGEVTDLHQNSMALYFTLTDSHAELPCMIWANHYRKMVADLGDGTEVILEADIDYWTEGGKIDLKPWEVVCC